MRYEDGPSVSVETVVDAPAEQVWAFVSDVDTPGRFSDEYQGGELLDGADAPATGARFRGRNHHPDIGPWETISWIVDCVPMRTFVWAVSDPDRPASQWRFDLTEEEDGRTRLRQTCVLGPGFSGVSYEIQLSPGDEAEIIERRLNEHRANMERVVEGIKALAEGAAHRP